MATESLTCDLLDPYREHARVQAHRGSATFELAGETYAGSAEVLLPASGPAVVAFHSATELTTQDFGSNLVIEGGGENGPFRVECAQCYIRNAGASAYGGFWNLISPVNGPARLQYGGLCAAHAATALLNNFDYRYGDRVATDNGGFTTIGTPLAVQAGRRKVTFTRRSEHARLLPLVRTGLLYSTSLVGIEFDLDREDREDTDEQELAFAVDVAALCTFATGSTVNVAMMDILDGTGGVVRRVIPQPVTSRYRQSEIVEDFHLPRLFSEAFAEYVEMKQAHSPWTKLASYCGSLQDAPFLEQKFAALIMALEFFMRNSLLERGQPPNAIARLDFSGLIGATRKHLGWDIPQHYMSKETARLLRNAVMHGDEPPLTDSAVFRRLFDKWRLFLFRRVLMRLGYTGKVTSPHKGWVSSSDVMDFAEEHNSFTPANPNEPDPWTQLVRAIREQQAHRQPD